MCGVCVCLYSRCRCDCFYVKQIEDMIDYIETLDEDDVLIEADLYDLRWRLKSRVKDNVSIYEVFEIYDRIRKNYKLINGQ